MSVELSGSDAQRLYLARVKRLTVGITLASMAAFGIGWTFSFLTPMLAASFLAAPIPRPPLKALVMMPVMIVVAFGLALLVSAFGLAMPFLAVLSISLLIFRCFYSLARGVARMFTMWALIGTLLIPVMSLKGMEVAVSLTVAIFWSGMAAMGFVWLAHVLVPDPRDVVVEARKKPAGGMGDLYAAAKFAFVRTIVILPVVSYILLTAGTSQLKILIFSATLSMNPALEKGPKGAIGLVTANLVGGLIAMLFYELQTMCPSLVFLSLQFMLLCLVFGREIFSGGKFAGLFSSALGTVILLFGLGVMPIGDDTDSQFYTRILHLLIAAIYVVFAFQVVSYYANWRIRRAIKRRSKAAAIAH